MSCGWKLQGSSSIFHSPKKNFKLLFRKKFGSGNQLHANLFGDNLEMPFRNLIVKNPTQDSWTVAQSTWRENARYMNDVWANETQRLMGHLTPRNRWVSVFIDGSYWGIYRLGERPDEHFVAAHSGGDKDDYDVFNSRKLKNGTRDLYTRCLAFAASPRLNEKAVYKKVKDYLDVPGFIDYFIYNIYAVNIDWPKKNYWLAGKRGKKPKFRFFNWDAEVGFWEFWDNPRNPEKLNALEFDQLEDIEYKTDRHGPGYLFTLLSKSDEFRLEFADKMYEHLLSVDGLLSPEIAAKRYRSHLDEVEPLLELESERWGGSQREVPYSTQTDEWKKLTSPSSWLFSEFFPKRSQDMIEDFRKKRLYPSIDPPEMKILSSQDKVFLKVDKGETYYRLDGRDPREKWTGKAIGIKYSKPFEIKKGQVLLARCLNNGEWSAVLKRVAEK